MKSCDLGAGTENQSCDQGIKMGFLGCGGGGVDMEGGDTESDQVCTGLDKNYRITEFCSK